MRSPGVALLRGSSIILQLVFVSLVARLAGTDTAGRFFSFYAGVLVCSSLTRLGAEYYLVACLPRLHEPEQSRRISTLNVTIVVLASVFLVLSLAAMSLLGTRLFGDSALAVSLFWVTVLLLSLNWSNVGALRGLGAYLKSVAMETVLYISVFLVALVVLKSVNTVTVQDLSALLLASIGLSVILGGVLGWWSGVRFEAPSLPAVTEIMRQSFPFWLASALAVANAWLPLLLLGQLAPPDDVSIYLLSQRLAAALLIGLTILNARFARDYAHLMSKGSINELRALYRRNTIAQLPFVIATAFLLMILAPPIFQFAGIPQDRGYPILIVLGVGTLASALCGPIVTASLATGHANSTSITIGGTLLIGVVTILALGDRMDGLLMAGIVAVMMALQNFTMYAWWQSRMKQASR